MSLYYCADSSFPFDMQMSWLEEFRSPFSVALKPLHYRGRIRGMPLFFCGFQIQPESVIRGCCGRVRKWVRMASLQRSQLSSWMEKSGEGLWARSDSGLKSFGWHWATQAVFIIDCTGTEGIQCCGYHYSWSLFFFSNYLSLIALQTKIKQPVTVMLDYF